MIESLPIIRLRDHNQESLDDELAVERPLTLYLNGQEWVTLLSSPIDLKELAVGYLYTSGVINANADIENLVIASDKFDVYIDTVNKDLPQELFGKRIYTSGCGKGIIFYNPIDLMHRQQNSSTLSVSFSAVLELMKRLQQMSATYQRTGGVHSAGLSDGKEILVFKEDIGRHNAVDKIIGAALLQGIDAGNAMVLTSGRVSSEVIFKVHKAQIPILVSQTAPTEQAAKIAQSVNITLIGFARGKRMNVYSGHSRIVQ